MNTRQYLLLVTLLFYSNLSLRAQKSIFPGEFVISGKQFNSGKTYYIPPIVAVILNSFAIKNSEGIIDLVSNAEFPVNNPEQHVLVQIKCLPNQKEQAFVTRTSDKNNQSQTDINITILGRGGEYL